MHIKGMVYCFLVSSLLLLTGCSQMPSSSGEAQQTFVEQYPDAQYVQEQDPSDLSGTMLLSGNIDSGSGQIGDDVQILIDEPQNGVIEQPMD